MSLTTVPLVKLSFSELCDKLGDKTGEIETGRGREMLPKSWGTQIEIQWSDL